ncbi:MAG: hypothetical protein R3F56_19870 [Planctomycetota bacterium]
MNLLRPLTLSCVFLAGSLAAQTVKVFPFDHVNLEGSSSITSRPLSAGVSRVMLIYSKWRLGIANGGQISRVGFRPDMLGTGTGHQVQMEIWMGHSDNLGTGVSTTFDNNYLAPAVRVYDRQIFSLPTVPSVSTGPNPNTIWIPLDRTFAYDNTHNLVVEYRIFANSNGNAAFTYRLDVGSFVSDTTTFGTACQTSSNRSPAITTQPVQAGGSMGLSLTNGPASSSGVLLIGSSNSTWNGVPLPLGLDSFGATGCTLQVAIDANVTISTNTGGALSVSLPVPGVLALYGRTLYFQAALGDLFANSAGFVTSASASTTIGVSPQATMLAATGSTTATIGSRTNSTGLISLFEY